MALSRTPHGMLDMATPAMGALLWLGGLPPVKVIFLGMITAFAGYTAVYALNDLVDYKVDRKRVQLGFLRAADSYLDDVLIRHPMAHGLLTFREGLWWTAAWGVVAVVGAFLLNPVCVAIFLGGCLLEMIYCTLLRISHLRTLVSGGVKTTGAIAAVFAVDPSPSAPFVASLFLLLFFWEIGAQNIPHDWADIEEDRQLDSRTIPVLFGPRRAAETILAVLAASQILSLAVFFTSGAGYRLPFAAAGLCGGFFLLLAPAWRLYRMKDKPHAMALFNRASYYPLFMLLLALVELASNRLSH
ncbi:MAG: ubiquinone biosynthesis protein UbiA [Desulfobacteraceae bacterium]|nr:MAG: ubiquinone biosynthesis protein UbiA [Desulfobacteraceae bacterium]